MRKSEIKVQASRGDTVLGEWNEPYPSTLPELVNAIERTKGIVNDFLTDLINQTKNTCSMDQTNRAVGSNDEGEVEDEGLEEDTLTKVLKEIVCDDKVFSNSEKNAKRKNSDDQLKRNKKKL